MPATVRTSKERCQKVRDALANAVYTAQNSNLNEKERLGASGTSV